MGQSCSSNRLLRSQSNAWSCGPPRQHPETCFGYTTVSTSLDWQWLGRGGLSLLADRNKQLPHLGGPFMLWLRQVDLPLRFIDSQESDALALLTPDDFPVEENMTPCYIWEDRPHLTRII